MDRPPVGTTGSLDRRINKLEDTLVVVRNSELSTYRSCRQKWEWAYRHRLKARKPSAPLAFGTLIHAVLERFYVPGIKRGGRPEELWEQVFEEFLEAGNEDFIVLKGEEVYASELGLAMMHEYWKEYGKDSEWKVLAPEQTFQLDLHDPETGEFLAVYTGTVDAVVVNRRTKKSGFLEHKTGSSLEPFGAPLILDEQSSAYWTFGQMFLEATGVLKEPLDFVLFNRLRKAMPDTRKRNAEGLALNKNGTVSKRQPLPLFKREFSWRGVEERQSTYDRVIAQLREMAMVRNGELPIYKNPDKHCGWCEFRDMCEVHESQSDWEAVRDGTMTTWDPYEDHKEQLEDD